MLFLVAGDANADIRAALARFPHEGDDSPIGDLGWTSGGSAANVATALARLGAPARLAARVGVDPAADLALRAARAARVDLGHVQRDASIATGLCFAAVSPGGERTFFSYRGANVALEVPHLEAAFLDVTWLHVGGHALLEGPQRDTARALIAEAVRRGVPVSLDLCLPLLREAPRALIEVLPRVRVLFANEQESDIFAEITTRPAEAVLVEKLGARGARVSDESGTIDVPAFPVEARDTTGCGDAFIGGFLLALAKGAPLEVAGRLGNALGALAATRPGAAEALPSRRDVRAFLTERGATAELAVVEQDLA